MVLPRQGRPWPAGCIPLALPLVGLALLLRRARAGRPLGAPSRTLLARPDHGADQRRARVPVGEAARRLDDARLFLVSLAFVTSAGFLALHALATPGVLLEKKNAGFIVATPVGLAIASIFAAASALDLSPSASAAVMRRQWLLRGIVFALLGAWGVYSLSNLPPLDRALTEEEAHGPLYSLAVLGLPLYAFAAVRYVQLYRRRPAPMPAAVAAAFTLLAEAMIAIAFGHNWHASWWEWHVLMAVAFGLVAFVAAPGVPAQALDRGRLQGSLPGAHGRADRPALCERAQRARRTSRPTPQTCASASTSATRRRSSSSRPPASCGGSTSSSAHTSPRS